MPLAISSCSSSTHSERYCVVFQTLRHGPALSVTRAPA